MSNLYIPRIPFFLYIHKRVDFKLRYRELNFYQINTLEIGGMWWDVGCSTADRKHFTKKLRMRSVRVFGPPGRGYP